ncbi:DUF7576 family protein [Halovivax gelatinilyticus]|uniref:DUF7576 family protein n=1 Tax=Halovivax gelatinilyticus TaxID=2961597 RepID=UPI0020CA8D9A|nr:hypothetical protein [Halovivax gelatinilyticus]
MDSDDEPQPTTHTSQISAERCTQCNAPIDTGTWYPVSKDRADDGSLELYPFCGEECQQSWLEPRSE